MPRLLGSSTDSPWSGAQVCDVIVTPGAVRQGYDDSMESIERDTTCPECHDSGKVRVHVGLRSVMAPCDACYWANCLSPEQEAANEAGFTFCAERAVLGLTQAEMADRLGVGEVTYQKAELGHAPSLSTLRRVARHRKAASPAKEDA